MIVVNIPPPHLYALAQAEGTKIRAIAPLRFNAQLNRAFGVEYQRLLDRAILVQ